MKYTDYIVSVILALVLLSALVVWTRADYADDTARFSCRAGQASPAVTLKGMVIYPRCVTGKRS
jgi:hypothetical protein